MILQPSLHHHHQGLKVSLPQATPYSPSVQLQNSSFTPPQKRHPTISITCASISQRHTYGKAVDYERRPMVNWKGVYRMISLMERPELGAGSVLSQCERSGKKLLKWELWRIIRELRSFKRHRQALEVYEWMKNRGEIYRLTASDAAIELDLIAIVHGVSAAKSFFDSVPSTLMDRRIHGALLNVYAKARMAEEAENMFATMRRKGYMAQALTFNVMMTLYMNLKQYDKVDMIISEMMDMKIEFDIYSYNIWLSSCGSQGSAEKMEKVFEQMKLDRRINPNWTTFSTMANMYIKMGEIEKAEDCLRNAESRITRRDRIPYHYLLSLYGRCGNKQEVYRLWNTYKACFPRIPNLGYHAVVSSLVRLGDIRGAEQIYEEWQRVRSSYDPRIGNLLMGFYVREGNVDKVYKFFDHMIEVGGRPNQTTWEILAQGHIKERRAPEALSCLKEAFAAEGSKSWKMKRYILSSFVSLCEEVSDIESKEVFLGLCEQAGYLKDEAYGSLIGLSTDDNESSVKKDTTGDEIDYAENDGSEMLVNQL